MSGKIVRQAPHRCDLPNGDRGDIWECDCGRWWKAVGWPGDYGQAVWWKVGFLRRWWWRNVRSEKGHIE